MYVGILITSNNIVVIISYLAVPAVLENGIQADATAYFGSVVTSDPIGTEVFRFRIVIDLSQFNDDLDAIVILMVHSNLVQSIFKLSDGENQRTFLFRNRGGIRTVNESRVFPEITLIENGFVVYEDHIIYQEAPPSSIELPTTLDFLLNLIVVGQNNFNSQQINFAIGTVYLTPPPGNNQSPCIQLIQYHYCH